MHNRPIAKTLVAAAALASVLAFIALVTAAPASAQQPPTVTAPPVADPQMPAMSQFEFGKLLVAQRCSNCHATELGIDTFAPPLTNLYGRKAGSVEGFTYSPNIKNLDVEWSAKTLGDWLTATTHDTPDIRMRHVGVVEPTSREAILAYIATLPGNGGK